MFFLQILIVVFTVVHYLLVFIHANYSKLCFNHSSVLLYKEL